MLKQVVRSAFKAAGLHVMRARNAPKTPLMALGIDVLLDVGANIGQSARKARNEGYRGRIVSFEPLPDAHARLTTEASGDPLWTVHDRCAVGAEAGVVEINISQNSFSSSILPMLGTHADAAPQSVYVGVAKTDVIALDSVFGTYVKPGDKVFLKIDTQGFESEVLKGAAASLDHIDVIQLELSTVPLYDGQKLYDYFFDLLRSRGFDLWSVEEGFVDPASGRMLQFDGIFVRR